MSGTSTEKPPHAHFFTENSEVGALMRAHDWSSSPLGLPEGWAMPLRTLVAVMLGSHQPMFVVWGPARTLLYNDAYAEILGRKHPEALGRSFLDVWAEIRGDLTPIVEETYAGRALHMDDITLVMHRKGYPEETHFAFSYTPVRDEDGAVAGLFCACTETTEEVHARAPACGRGGPPARAVPPGARVLLRLARSRARLRDG